jgi:hypothetical protein
MQKFLLFLAGARQDILDQVPAERARFLILGASVLFSSAFTAVITGASLTLIQMNVVLASAGGCLMGVFLLNLDSQLAAIHATRSGRLLSAVPRVLLALLCGIIFSTALAIGTLGPEVNAQLAIIKQNAQTEFLQQQSMSALGKEANFRQNDADNLSNIIATGGGATLNQSDDPTLVTLKSQLNAAQAAETNAFESWQCQVYGISANGQKCLMGDGPVTQEDEARYLTDKDTVTSLQQQITSREQQLTSSGNSARQARLAAAEQQLPGVNLEIEEIQKTLNSETANFNAENNGDNGLLRKIQALDELTESNSSLRAYTLFIFSLITILQCFPLLLRVVRRSGPYEKTLEAAQRREELRAQYRMRAAEGVLLEQVLDRESIGAGRSPATTEPVTTGPAAMGLARTDGQADEITDEVEDMALRGMQDMRAEAIPAPDGQRADPA